MNLFFLAQLFLHSLYVLLAALLLFTELLQFSFFGCNLEEQREDDCLWVFQSLQSDICDRNTHLSGFALCLIQPGCRNTLFNWPVSLWPESDFQHEIKVFFHESEDEPLHSLSPAALPESLLDSQLPSASAAARPLAADKEETNKHKKDKWYDFICAGYLKRQRQKCFCLFLPLKDPKQQKLVTDKQKVLRIKNNFKLLIVI